jgi:hypothetical protein
MEYPTNAPYRYRINLKPITLNEEFVSKKKDPGTKSTGFFWVNPQKDPVYP